MENITKIEDLIDPEVIGDSVEREVLSKIKVSKIADVDTTLVGRPGTTLTVPKFSYIGDAVVVAEGEEIPVSKLKASTTTFTIKKAGKGVEITDEAVLSGFGDPIGEATDQLALSIASKIDDDSITELVKTKTTQESEALTVQSLINAVDLFELEDDEPLTIIINPKDLTKLKLSLIERQTGLGDSLISNGILEEVIGGELLVTKRIKEGTVVVARKGALKIILKRETQIEPDRIAKRKITALYADKHYGVYLHDDSKAVKLTIKAATKAAGDKK